MKPVVAANSPIEVELEKGEEYFFCRCGRSRNQPFCDGSHRGTGFTPLRFVAEESGKSWLCRCKQTGTAPYCNGNHRKVPDEMVGKEFSLAESQPDEIAAQDQPPEAEATPEEPTVAFIHALARGGLETFGAHGPIDAMGVPRSELPDWNDIQIMTAQLVRQPLMDDAEVDTRLVIGPGAKKPLELDIPLLVSDMSFGALSEEAKIALAKGAELAGTAISSGEGGMLPEEQQANSRYRLEYASARLAYTDALLARVQAFHFKSGRAAKTGTASSSGEGGMLPEEQQANRRYMLEYASARFGYSDALLDKVQAFHFKCGQAAKTGTGGHLPGSKVKGRIAEVRHLPEGQDAISPATFKDLHTVEDFARFADRVRELTGGIPVGFKLSAQHIEKDIEFAVRAGADYIILDGRGGGTGAAPLMFRDHISVPTIPALARARRCLDQLGASGRVTLIITGGLRTHVDFIKALALGADGVALANSAMQAVGCIGARICHTNRCPTGVATQDPKLRRLLKVEPAARQLGTFLDASVALMQVLARACGHDRFDKFSKHDLASWHRDMAELAGIQWSGFND